MPIRSSGLSVTKDEIDSALMICNDIADFYSLNKRHNRVTAHGTAPVLTHILEAYETDTGSPIPSYTYSDRDDSDRHEMARLAANRFTDVAANMHPGTGISSVNKEGLGYVANAWGWFIERDFEFPDGRILSKKGNGIGVEWPDVPADGVGVEDEALAQEALTDMGFYGDMGSGVHMPDPTPVVYSKYDNGSVSRERAQLAIEVAAQSGSTDLAQRVLVIS